MDKEQTGLSTKIRDLVEYAKRGNMVLFEGAYVGGGDLPTFRWSETNTNAMKFIDFAQEMGARVLFYKVYFFTSSDIDECKWELDAVRNHLDSLDVDEPRRKEYRSKLFEYLARLNAFQEHLEEVGEIMLQVKVDGDLYEYIEDEEWYEGFKLLLDEIRSLHEELDEDSEDLNDGVN